VDGDVGAVAYLGAEVNHLQTLPGQAAPSESIAEAQLEAMGHPAPFSNFDWTEEGQRAKLRYAEGEDLTRPPDKDARQNGNVGEIHHRHLTRATRAQTMPRCGRST